MKTRSLVIVVLPLALLLAIAPSSTAHALDFPTRLQSFNSSELTVPTAATGLPAAPDSSPSSNLPCEFAQWVTVYCENFDPVTTPALPTGWASAPINGPQGVWRTHAGTVQPLGGSAATPPNLVYFNSFDAPAGQTARLYRSTPLDLRHYKELRLCVRYYQDPGWSDKNDRVQPQVSTNGGSSWIDVGTALTRYDTSPGWSSTDISITSVAAGESSVYLGFLGISEFGNDVHLDDIKVIAIPAIYLPLMGR